MTGLIAKIRSKLLYWMSWAIIVLPSWLKNPIYRYVYGYKIGKHVKIKLSWIFVGKLDIADWVIIRGGNRIKNIPEVFIGSHTTIGTGNTFTSTAEFCDPRSFAQRGNRPRLIIGQHCGISKLHYIDVQDTFKIGDYTSIAGIGSVFFTHYLDVISSTQSAKPILIGRYCMIGSNARFTPGAGLPDCCVVGMGAIVTKQFTETHTLIGGNPAVVIRKLPEDAAYFTRTVGWIGSFGCPPDARWKIK
jgi:acetyltransferase-like isoleucine patch superfamily enzyme